MSELLADIQTLDKIADPHTHPALLPGCLKPRDNNRRRDHAHRALRQGLSALNNLQREQIRLHYAQGLRKSEIAKIQNKTCSAVSKSMQAGERSLRRYVGLYMEIFDRLEREFLREEY